MHQGDATQTTPWLDPADGAPGEKPAPLCGGGKTADTHTGNVCGSSGDSQPYASCGVVALSCACYAMLLYGHSRRTWSDGQWHCRNGLEHTQHVAREMKRVKNSIY